MTVVLPEPVAILQAIAPERRRSPRPSGSSLGSSSGIVDALQEVGARLGQEDDRLGRLELGEEQPVLAALARQ